MKVISDAFREDDHIIIAVGSAQAWNAKDNPFSFDERKKMLELALFEIKKTAKIVSIPDIGSDEDYVKHIEKIVFRKADKLITENIKTIQLFERAGYKVDVTPRHFDLSATKIRETMANGQAWEDFLPIAVARYINKIDGVQRIQKLFLKEAKNKV
jgi:nicotinamide-nucleotide adenylyltransferase